jgi:hypothetical protein
VLADYKSAERRRRFRERIKSSYSRR